MNLGGMAGGMGNKSLHKFNDFLMGCVEEDLRICDRRSFGYINRVPGLFSLGWVINFK